MDRTHLQSRTEEAVRGGWRVQCQHGLYRQILHQRKHTSQSNKDWCFREDFSMNYFFKSRIKRHSCMLNTGSGFRPHYRAHATKTECSENWVHEHRMFLGYRESEQRGLCPSPSPSSTAARVLQVKNAMGSLTLSGWCSPAVVFRTGVGSAGPCELWSRMEPVGMTRVLLLCCVWPQESNPQFQQSSLAFHRVIALLCF
jgi:hypothetical protein